MSKITFYPITIKWLNRDNNPAFARHDSIMHFSSDSISYIKPYTNNTWEVFFKQGCAPEHKGQEFTALIEDSFVDLVRK